MNRPRCLVTGSCYGLGKALVREFAQDHEVIEYDIVLGQDLNSLSVRQQLIEDLKTCRIFFNNCQVYQRELLFRAHELQTGLCQVVSNSAITYFAQPEWIQQDQGYQEYIHQKQLLDQDVLLIHNLQLVQPLDHKRHYLINVKLTWMNTPQHEQITIPKMDCAQVASTLRSIIELYPNVAVPELILSSAWPDSQPILTPTSHMLPQSAF